MNVSMRKFIEILEPLTLPLIFKAIYRTIGLRVRMTNNSFVFLRYEVIRRRAKQGMEIFTISKRTSKKIVLFFLWF